MKCIFLIHENFHVLTWRGDGLIFLQSYGSLSPLKMLSSESITQKEKQAIYKSDYHYAA